MNYEYEFFIPRTINKSQLFDIALKTTQLVEFMTRPFIKFTRPIYWPRIQAPLNTHEFKNFLADYRTIELV